MNDLNPSDFNKRIDNLCEEFFRQRTVDPSVNIEGFLAAIDVDDVLQLALIPELIPEEVESRKKNGEIVDRFEYEERFPGFVEAIKLVFSRLTASEQVLGITRDDPRNPEKHLEIKCHSEAEIPKTLGQFEVFEKIGSGEFGVVYRAEGFQPFAISSIKFPRSRVVRSV